MLRVFVPVVSEPPDLYVKVVSYDRISTSKTR